MDMRLQSKTVKVWNDSKSLGGPTARHEKTASRAVSNRRRE